MLKRAIFALILALAVAAPAAAQTIVLVRHAERADEVAPNQTRETDPDLSEAGRARAVSLAAALKDAQITAVYATEYKRTQQTAAPLAKTLGLTVTVVKAKDRADLVAQLKASTGNVLVVGHSDTVPQIITGLGVAARVSIHESSYDNLFMVTPGTPPSLLHLHYR
jgi:phosphohistidine phosphatase SixA